MNMEIQKNTIVFESNPVNFRKEKSGIKCNTVRRIPKYRNFLPDLAGKEWLEEWLDFDYDKDNLKMIRIVNTESRESFLRRLSDMTRAFCFEENNIFYETWVFSWIRERRLDEF
jgi:hypothetical protein